MSWHMKLSPKSTNTEAASLTANRGTAARGSTAPSGAVRRGGNVAFGPTAFSYHNLGHLEHVNMTQRQHLKSAGRELFRVAGHQTFGEAIVVLTLDLAEPLVDFDWGVSNLVSWGFRPLLEGKPP